MRNISAERYLTKGFTVFDIITVKSASCNYGFHRPLPSSSDFTSQNESVASSTDVLVVNISSHGRILVPDPPVLDLFCSDPQTVRVCEKAGTV